MADLAKLVVRLEAQSAQLLAELDKANRKIDRFAHDTKSTIKEWAETFAAAFTIEKGTELAKQQIEYMDSIGKAAQAAGASVEEYSAMAYALKGSGLAAEETAKILLKVGNSAVEASKGNNQAAAAWKALGVNVEDANGHVKDSNELMLEAADAFAAAKDGPEKAAIASDIFGDKLATRLIPFLDKGRAGIKDLTDEAAKFGQVVSGQAAAQANEFNDNIARLGSLVTGVVNKAIGELLPNLTALTNEMVQSAKESGGLDLAARALATGLRILISGGLIVSEVFGALGKVVGAVAASISQAAHGDFQGAFNTLKEGGSDLIGSIQATGAELDTLWQKTGENIVDAANQTDAALKKTLVYGGKGGEDVEEVTITGVKRRKDAWQQYYDDLNDLTKTNEEKALSSYYKQEAALNELRDAGQITAEQYKDRMAAALDELLPEVEVHVRKFHETVKKDNDEFYKELARNSTDIIANTLENGFDKGAQGVLYAFAEMLRKLAAQALAAEIGRKIFGDSQGGGAGNGWLGLALKAAGSFFGGGGGGGSGGGAAEGRSYVPAGMSLMVGERGPEKFVPDVPGKVVSNEDLRTAPQVNVPLQVVNVDDPNKIPNFFKSEKGSQSFLNLLTDNRQVVRQILQGG